MSLPFGELLSGIMLRFTDMETGLMIIARGPHRPHWQQVTAGRPSPFGLPVSMKLAKKNYMVFDTVKRHVPSFMCTGCRNPEHV